MLKEIIENEAWQRHTRALLIEQGYSKHEATVLAIAKAWDQQPLNSSKLRLRKRLFRIRFLKSILDRKIADRAIDIAISEWARKEASERNNFTV